MYFAKILVSAVIMSVAVIVVKNLVKSDSKIIGLFVPVGAGVIVYFASCIILGVNELRDIFGLVMKKFSKKEGAVR